MADQNDTDTAETPAEKPTSKADHNFRYLLPPGNNFAFVAKFRTWIVLSLLLMSVAIGSLFLNKARKGEYMNWNIDFKGGTDLTFSFKNKSTGKYERPDAAKVRTALDKGGEDGFEISDKTWDDTSGATIEGFLVRSPRFSALKPESEAAGAKAFAEKFGSADITRAAWSGDRFYVKTKKRAISNAEAVPVFAAAGLKLKPWSAEETAQYTHADEGTGEYSATFAMEGLDKQYLEIFQKALPDYEAKAENSEGVGAKAGDKLRDDAAKSIIYAIFLIMLYLAFRFDIRYAPGAAFATIHDAIMVIGVFALTWTEVSLTSVAGLLTVMGYSVNDTVIVFDRIRENQAKLKDKKIEKIIDISINEMLVRTILTSSTVFATTLIMNIFGTGLVRNFAFAMNIGVIVGTYSSIFLAAPIFMYISRRWYSGPAKKRAVPVSAPKAEPSDDE